MKIYLILLLIITGLFLSPMNILACTMYYETYQASTYACVPCVTYNGGQIMDEENCFGDGYSTFKYFNGGGCSCGGGGGGPSCTVGTANLGTPSINSSAQTATLPWAMGWSPGSDPHAEYLSVSNSNATNADGGLQNVNVVNAVVTNTTSYTTGYLSTGTYYWDIVSDGCSPGQRRISSIGSFIICKVNPATLNTPVVNGSNVTTSWVMGWSPGSNARAEYLGVSTSRTLNVADGALGNPNVVNAVVTSTTSYTRSYSPGTYYWDIVSDGCSPGQRRVSSIGSFTVCVPWQACTGTCHTNTYTVPNGACGSTTCSPNAPAAQSCPTTCHTNTQYVPNGSCGQTTCGPNAPAWMACPGTCHTYTYTVPNGACGSTTCSPNAPAYVACPTACGSAASNPSNGACSTHYCAAPAACPTCSTVWLMNYYNGWRSGLITPPPPVTIWPITGQINYAYSNPLNVNSGATCTVSVNGCGATINRNCYVSGAPGDYRARVDFTPTTQSACAVTFTLSPGNDACDGTSLTTCSPAYGNACFKDSSPNSCGKTYRTSGTTQCDGVTCNAATPTTPTECTPTGLSSSCGANDTAILSWGSQATNGATSYNVTVNGVTTPLVADPPSKSINIVPGATNSWSVAACGTTCSTATVPVPPTFTCGTTITPWIQVTGDVHSNTGIDATGGP